MKVLQMKVNAGEVEMVRCLLVTSECFFRAEPEEILTSVMSTVHFVWWHSDHVVHL